jgi:hypothetical protein
MTSAMAAGPFAAVPVAAVAVLHLVILLPVLATFATAIVVLATHCQAGNGKNH